MAGVAVLLVVLIAALLITTIATNKLYDEVHTLHSDMCQVARQVHHVQVECPSLGEAAREAAQDRLHHR